MKGIEMKGVGKGQTLVTAYPIDKSTAGTVGDSAMARHGRPLGGSVSNLSHSLQGASATQQTNTKKNRFT